MNQKSGRGRHRWRGQRESLCWAEQKMHRWAAGTAEEGRRRGAGPGPGLQPPPQALGLCPQPGPFEGLPGAGPWPPVPCSKTAQQPRSHPRAPALPGSVLLAPSLGVPARRVEEPCARVGI